MQICRSGAEEGTAAPRWEEGLKRSRGRSGGNGTVTAESPLWKMGFGR